MNTNLNVSPYFDDFDEQKNFHQVLFKPGLPVQSRELTQLQSILQNQIEKFGRHVFKEGSIVIPGAFNLETDCNTVKIDSASTITNSGLDSLVGKVITGTTNNCTAYVQAVAKKTVWNTDNHILFVKYLSGSVASNVFVAEETITVADSITTFDLDATTPIGNGSLFTIDSGVIFSRGFFVSFNKQTIILDPESQIPTAKIGFISSEAIVTSEGDQTLLDPAQGSYNYAAPGADRLKISVTLHKATIEEELTLPDFISLFTIKEGTIQNINERPEYNILEQEIAKRTYDESGDYIVNGFGVLVREHLDVDDNEGYLPLVDGGDSSKLAIGIEPGTAYVKGFEVRKHVTEYVVANKSTAYDNVNSEIIATRNGNYLKVNEMVGGVILDEGTSITLYDTAEQRVTEKISSATVPGGVVIGTAKVKTIVNNTDGEYLVYLFDIIMETGENFSSTKGIGISGEFFADVVLTNNKAVLQETGGAPLLFPLSSDHVRNVKDSNGNTDTLFSFKRSFDDVSINTNGEFSITVNTSSESHAYGSSGTLTGLEKASITLNFKESTAIAMGGTVGGSSGDSTLTGNSSYFTRLNVGDRISITDVAGTFTVASIASNTSLEVVETFPGNFSTTAFSKVYLEGDIIDLTSKGVDAGTERLVTVTNTDTLTFDLQETYTENISALISIDAFRSSAIQIKKTLRPNRFVKFTCSTLGSLTGPIDLGFSDVYKIRQIRKDTSAFTTSNQGQDVTNSFLFDNGQRDDFYTHATITPNITLTSSDYLLVELDYFYIDMSQGVGYFSIDSYTIDDVDPSDTELMTHEIPVYKSPITGAYYNLRNMLDFRPVKQNTATDATTVGTASVNPAGTNNFVNDSNGLRIPLPYGDAYCDFSYYLARRDVISINKSGEFSIIEGISAIHPVTPRIDESVMGVASMYIPPYPSMASTYARILDKGYPSVSANRITNRRYTMRDIGVLNQRIQNLEYYNIVNLLEKSVMDMLVLDEDGLERFKNGYFIDDFVDHSLGATYNVDYNIAVDKNETVIRPIFDFDSFNFGTYVSNLSSGVQKTGNLITLPYTESTLLSQNKASNYRNIEQSVFRFIGKMTLTPDIDTWVDTSTVDVTTAIGANKTPAGTEILKTEWGSWETYVIGKSTTVETTSGEAAFNLYARAANDIIFNGDEKLFGTFPTLKAAQDAMTAKSLSHRGFIETVIGGGTTTTTDSTTTQQSRTGTQNTNITTQERDHIGTFVTDVSIVPYIKPQIINIFIRGLKPNTTFFCFFDGENMTSYVTPTDITTNIPLNTEGSVWTSDENGIIRGDLRLPVTGKRFRIGTKEIRVSDNEFNADQTVSYAIGHFVASGLNAEKQDTFLSTSHTVKISTPVKETQREITKTKVTTKTIEGTSKIQIFGPSCMAYSFKVEAPVGEQGIFLTSADVFIKSKSSTLGLWIEIREMSIDGNITRTQIPYSEVWIKSEDIVTTSDGSTPLTITFPSPVFLLNDTQYAFVIHTEGLNPDYYFWVSYVGETDVATNLPITGRQLTGTLYTTNNNLNWDVVPDADLKITFKRAEFITNTPGAVVLGNNPYEFINTTAPSSPFYNIPGETVTGSEYLTLTMDTGNAPIVTDKIIGDNVTSNVIAVNGSTYYTDGNGLVNGESVSIVDSNDVEYDPPKTATITSLNYGSGKLYKFDDNTNKLILKDSNGKFFENCVLTGTISDITSTVDSFDQYDYSVITTKPKYIAPYKTSVSFETSGIKKSNNTMNDYIAFIPDTTVTHKEELCIKSKYDEINSYSNSPSTRLKATLNTTSKYVSPVIDTALANGIFVHNIVNEDITGENGTNGGNLINKYITKIVTLADGQDAEDILVTTTSYLPQGTDVKIWAKLRNGEDGDLFSARTWIELEKNDIVYSSSINTNDFREFSYKLPTSYMVGPNDVFQYTANGNSYAGFKQFSIKIGLLSNNAAVVPRVADVGIIALQL